MALTDMQIRQAKPREKRYTLSDGRGLIMEINPNGSKYWILRHWKDGKETRKHIGQFPELSVRDARALAAEIKAGGGEAVISEAPTPAGITFGNAAAEWLSIRMADKSERYIERIKGRLNNYILPCIGGMEIDAVKPADVLNMCRLIEDRGSPSTAQRCRQIAGQVFRYAVAAGKAETDPTPALRGALKPHKEKHMAAITDESRIAELMQSIRAYPFFVVRCALLFSAYTFARPGEVRHAEWSEIDLDAAEWRIAAEKMKMRRPHIVPLAPQVINILNQLREHTGGQKWVFPSARGEGRQMSENAVRLALRFMGFTAEEMTAHGFRGMASTCLNELGYPPDVIERQLAHADRNAVRAAYNHAEYLTERRKMMSDYADYLDALADGGM